MRTLVQGRRRMGREGIGEKNKRRTERREEDEGEEDIVIV